MGYQLPGHKYLGPGNSLDRGLPSNFIDDDARIHDTAYANSKSSKDVRNADRNFIASANDHIANSLSGRGGIFEGVAAGLGSLGINIKQTAERVAGPIYPNIKCESTIS